MSLEQVKIEIKELYKKRNELLDKRSYYREKLKNYKMLQDRSECPCCEQKTNREYFKNKIPKTKEKFQELLNEIKIIIPKIQKLEKIVRKDNENKNKEHRKQINNYIQQNRNKLNKCIREYYKGIENYLPNISKAEKELWNEAMEHHLDNKNIDENTELYFENENI